MNKMQQYMIEALMYAFLALFLLWAAGYICNGVYGMHFELQSCWGGFQAIGGAGTLAAIKYIMDSWKNTPEGKAPSYGPSVGQKVVTAVMDALPQPQKTEEEEVHKGENA